LIWFVAFYEQRVGDIRTAINHAMRGLRQEVEDLQVYMREQLAKLSRGHDLAKAFNYILKRWAKMASRHSPTSESKT
jgi:hypothetical protein